MTAWLTVKQGNAPLIVSLPHTGTKIPASIESQLTTEWLARKDTDWWIDRLYDFASDLDATVVHTAISRTVIDVNRDPSGASLYPGQATTELCPTTTFDSEPLYRGKRPDAAEIEARRQLYFAPYHDALREQITRLRTLHGRIVLYDCHSIRSVIPRLFEGTLPEMNIGTNSSTSCDPVLTEMVVSLIDESRFSRVVNGRFKGGWITRQYGQPQNSVHAIQMELACRSYMRETPGPVTEDGWPVPYEPAYAQPMRELLLQILRGCLKFAQSQKETRYSS